MAERLSSPNWVQRIGQRVAATPWMARLMVPTAHRLDRPILKLSGGRFSLTTLVAGLPIVTLTTIGAKSGQPRTVPLVGILDGDKVIVIASNFGQTHHPAWYHNLRANPTATLVVDGRSGSYVAHEATGAEYDAYWQKAVSLYAGYAAYKERTGGRPIPILVLSPKQDQD